MTKMSRQSETPIKPTDNQMSAIESLDGRLFIAAGAGSGKTAVVAHRFVEAIACGKARVDEILTITFTRKAAAEMMQRIRKELRQRAASEDDPDKAMRLGEAFRNVERAPISTIDSFCSQVLRANALAAGIDPAFTTASEEQAAVISRECFEGCLPGFIRGYGDAAADLVTAYDPGLRGKLFDIVNEAYRELRCRGREPELPLPDAESLILQAGEKLKAALDDFDAAVERESASNKTVAAILEGNRRLREALRESNPAIRLELVRQSRPGGSAGKVNNERQALEAVWNDYLNALLSPGAREVLELFNALLNEYHSAYGAEKYNRGVLDFADLSTFTRDLLRDKESIRHSLSSRFKLIMVDEFQDTNPLQYEIIGSIAQGNLMMVGDENQSIFGFRDAEVDLFRDEKAAAEKEKRLIPLVENFRSQPEILTFVDHLFQAGDMLGESHLELIPKADKDPNREDFRVEVIMVDRKPPGKDQSLAVEDARRVEAQLIAERLSDIYREGNYSSGDTAILMATRAGVEVYRDALESAGIDSYLSIGVSYFQRIELGDAINLFRLIINPLDDEALVGALRSPMARVSDDSIFWMRQAAGRDPLWHAIRDQKSRERFPPEDRSRLEIFASGLSQLREFSRRESLAQITQRVIYFADYAVAAAAGPNGKQVLANLTKLIDLAADFESAWGKDLADFARFLENQRSAQKRESEPPVEEEDVAAVRIMTMHSAKGLEFPLVVLPKLSGRRGGAQEKAQLLLDRDRHKNRIGLNYRSLTDEDQETFHYRELASDLKSREAEEEKRLHYVAMTRAERHLILVGHGKAGEKAKKGDGSRPFDWIRSLLGLDRKSRPEIDEMAVIRDLKGVEVGVRICDDPEAVLAAALSARSAREFISPQPVSPNINSVPGPAGFVPQTISPTALDTFNACARRFYWEVLLRVSDLFDAEPPATGSKADGNLGATAMGTLVHSVLETHLPVLGGEPLTAEFLNERARETAGREALLSPEDIKKINGLIENLKKAELAKELFPAAQSAVIQQEVPFSTRVGEVIMQGKMDALLTPAVRLKNGAATLVVDFKTGSPGDDISLEESAETYKYQMDAYALAAHRMHGGPVDVALMFLGGDRPVEFVKNYGEADFTAIESEIRAILADMRRGVFAGLSRFDEHHCAWCAAGPHGANVCRPASG